MPSEVVEIILIMCVSVTFGYALWCGIEHEFQPFIILPVLVCISLGIWLYLAYAEREKDFQQVTFPIKIVDNIPFVVDGRIIQVYPNRNVTEQDVCVKKYWPRKTYYGLYPSTRKNEYEVNNGR